MTQQCPNCLKPVRFWSNYSGYCSKRCRSESTTACPNCGTVGLYKHHPLGCCSAECRCWYQASMLGYDRAALLTPAEDKIVYHVRLPSNNPEISSLQHDELDYERRRGTILVIASPPWMTRQRVLAELPFERFDNPAWQHLLIDGLVDPSEIEEFRAYLYDDAELHHRLGGMVYQRLRMMAPAAGMAATVASVASLPIGLTAAQTATAALRQRTTLGLPQGTSVPAQHLGTVVRQLFERRGYAVSPMQVGGEEVLLLTRGQRQSVVRYIWQEGVVDLPAVQQFAAWAAQAGVTHGYLVTTGFFSIQAEDWARTQPVQLIDGTELRALTRTGGEVSSATGAIMSITVSPPAFSADRREALERGNEDDMTAAVQPPADMDISDLSEHTPDAILTPQQGDVEDSPVRPYFGMREPVTGESRAL